MNTVDTQIDQQVLPAVLTPFLRWAGSKRRLLSQLVTHIPPTFNTYFEPFLGGGSLYLHLQPEKAILGDMLPPLANVWNEVARDAISVHQIASQWKLEKDTYYRVRELRPLDGPTQAAQFLYLNKTAFNGLWRVNLNGKFNVPWGAPKSQFIADLENLKAVGNFLTQNDSCVKALDFQNAVEQAGDGDLVFLDPPYVSKHNDSGFAHYNEKIFSWEDQERLATTADQARLRGATVLVTNANHASLHDLYPAFEHHVLLRRSTLAASANKRVAVTESLFVGAP